MSHKDYGKLMEEIRDKYGPHLQEEYFRRMGVQRGATDGSVRGSGADPIGNSRERSDRPHSGGAQRPRNEKLTGSRDKAGFGRESGCLVDRKGGADAR
jgi:hypothetical protein